MFIASTIGAGMVNAKLLPTFLAFTSIVSPSFLGGKNVPYYNEFQHKTALTFHDFLSD